MRIAAVLVLLVGFAGSSAEAQEVRFLYAPIVVSQFADLHSTRVALGRPGTMEGNPVWRGCASSTPCLVTMKSAASAGLIFFAEKARRKHPRLVFFVMAGVTAGATTIAVRNYRVGVR